MTSGVGQDQYIHFQVSQGFIRQELGQDTILDFSIKQQDKIHLSSIDANSLRGGNQAFEFIGAQSFSGRAGELQMRKAASDTYISGDVNGDKIQISPSISTMLSSQTISFSGCVHRTRSLTTLNINTGGRDRQRCCL